MKRGSISTDISRRVTPYFIIITCLFCVLSSQGHCQSNSVMATGDSPYAQYDLADIDNVNPINGNLYLKLPLLSFPQRGSTLRLAFYIYYNDKQWVLANTPYCQNQITAPGVCLPTGQYTGVWTPTTGPQVTGGPPVLAGAYVARDQYVLYGSSSSGTQALHNTPGFGYITTTSTTSYYAQTPDGSVHVIGDETSANCQSIGEPCPTSQPSTWGPIANSYPALDGSGFDGSGHDSDGIVYQTSPILTPSAQTSGTPSSVSDPTGNVISASSTGWTDTMGRSIPGSLTGPGTWPITGSSPETPIVGDLIPGIAMSSSQLTVSWCPSDTTSGRIWTVPASQSYKSGTATYYFCYKPYSYSTAFNVTSLIPNWQDYWVGVSEATPGTALMLTAIILPDHSAYTFTYDQYLSLTNLGLPSGATVQYTWQNVMFNSSSQTTPISRALKTRTVTPGGGQPPEQTTYHFYITQNPQNFSVPWAYSVTTDALNNDREYTLSGPDDANVLWNFTILGIASYSGCSPHDVASDKTCVGSGALMKATTFSLNNGAPFYVPGPPVPTAITTHVPSAAGVLLSRQINAYVSGICKYTEPNAGNPYVTTFLCGVPQLHTSATYDFGTPGAGSPGPLLNTVTKSYIWQASTSYFAADLVKLISKTAITDGSGAPAAETDYNYDENNGSPQGILGHLTSVKNVNSVGPSPQSSFVYNSYGTVFSSTDARGNQIKVASWQCANTLPQQVISAYQSTTTLPEITAYSYDCNTGKILTVTDPNSVVTQYTYNDPLDRLKLVQKALGSTAETRTSYNYPSATEVDVAHDRVTTGDGLLTSSTIYDGLGRTIHTTDSSSATVDTSYDPLGRIQSVTNPYFGTTIPSNITTTYAYDPLGRKILQTQPDHNILQWCYNGVASNEAQTICSKNASSLLNVSWMDSSDETGRHWQHASDGLNRLVATVEPDPVMNSLALETDYSYNTLNNLSSVSQHGSSSATPRTRSFTYDSLSRLITSTNPETGTICYGQWSGVNCINGYDGNGNLQYKTDARGITTSYSYDTLNRLLSKTYLNDPTGTASSCFQYDTSSLVTGTAGNLVGRLTNSWTQKGTCPPASSPPAFLSNSAILNRQSVLAYDAMGRVLSEQQCTLSNCASGIPYTPAYSYDLAGNTIAHSNGIANGNAAMTFTNCYDSAGHLSLVASGNVPCSTAPTASALLFSAPSYSPHGGLTSATFGTGLQLTRTYDSRLRVVSETDIGASVASPTTGSAVVAIPGSEQIH